MARTTTIERKVRRAKRRLRRTKQFTKAQKAALIRSALRPSCSVQCFYGGGMIDRSLDVLLLKLARNPSSGGGLWLTTGLRDIEFDYPTVEKAEQAAKRIKAAKVRGPDGKLIHVMLRGYWKA